jgi:NAD(P)-dependent dehydrogenase (short-subunit alcohol dehydrogenase family)
VADFPDSIYRIHCDHLQDDETAAAFSIATREAGRLDVLVNSAWGGYERMEA